MTRFRVATVVLLTSLIGAGCAGALAPSSTRRFSGELWIVDAHEHVMPGLTPEVMISLMDELGISKVVLMAVPGGPRGTHYTVEQLNGLTLDIAKRYPSRVIPFLALNSVHEITLPLLKYLDGELATGRFLGMGELQGLHLGGEDRSGGGTPIRFPRIAIPLDSPGALDVMCLAARYNVVLTIHMGGPPGLVSASRRAGLVSALERALERNPNTKVIWAHQHIGHGEPEQLAALLDKYPNLYADLSPAHGRPSPAALPLVEGWKRVYEKYGDRFVLGLDNPFLVSWTETPERARGAAGLMRSWLSQLSPDTQRKLAHENIERILAAKPASIKTCALLTTY